MGKRTYNDKLHNNNGLPKIEDFSDRPDFISRYGGSKMLIAAPIQYNEIMAKVPGGMVITTDRIRAYLAEKAGADTTCALTAGIFINICANASAERAEAKIPYWRTLKSQGELNEKYPEGIDGQKMQLQIEGHEIIQKGKRYYVKDYEKNLWQIE